LLQEFDEEENEYILSALQKEQDERSERRKSGECKVANFDKCGTICVAHDYDMFECTSVGKHSSGSSRSEGYYKQKVQEKKKPVNAAVVNSVTKPIDGPNQRVSSRATRVQSRNLTQGLEVHYTTQDTTLLKVNQLANRKKGLKFGKSEIHDWGLFAMEKIDASDIVIEYIGEKIRQKCADQREKMYEKSGIGSSYLFRVDDDVIIDATKKGNLARFINHCCDVRCFFVICNI
jgi:histone-lysine N-methyltransferase SETD1